MAELNKCDPGNIVFTSNPPQYICIRCGRMWDETQKVPDCRIQGVTPCHKCGEPWTEGHRKYRNPDCKKK